MTCRIQLAEGLSRIDGVIIKAESHVEKPDNADLQARAARALDDILRARREVEGKLRVE